MSNHISIRLSEEVMNTPDDIGNVLRNIAARIETENNTEKLNGCLHTSGGKLIAYWWIE